MNKLLLEVELLKFWKSSGLNFLYKYKHRVKGIAEEGLTNPELFHDLTSGGLFRDVPDIASYSDLSANEAKVEIDELLSKRETLLSQNE